MGMCGVLGVERHSGGGIKVRCGVGVVFISGLGHVKQMWVHMGCWVANVPGEMCQWGVRCV